MSVNGDSGRADQIRHTWPMQRDRNVVAALLGALALLVALVIGSSRESAATSRRNDASIARTKPMPQLLVAVAVRSVRARPTSPGVSADCDRRAHASHDAAGSAPDALPPTLASLPWIDCSEHGSVLGRVADGVLSPRATWQRPEARAPPS